MRVRKSEEAAFRRGMMVLSIAFAACGGDDASPGTPAKPDGSSRVQETDAALATAGPDAGVDAGLDASPVAFTRPQEVLSGMRLKGYFVRTADGAEQLLGLYDTVLKTECDTQRAEDGRFRCLPPSPGDGAFDGDRTFADAECRRTLLPEESACAQSYAVVSTTTGAAVYRLGPATQPAMVYRRTSASPGCEPMTPPPGRRYFTLGEKLAATTFVERLGTRTDGPQTQRISAIYEQFMDRTNARLHGVLWDRDLQANCAVRPAADGVLRCLPSTVGAVSVATFADAACTTPVVLGASSGTPPAYAVRAMGTGCGLRTSVYSVGPKLAPMGLFRKSGDTCVPAMNLTGVYYQLAEELPARRFSAFQRVPATGAARLRERWVVNDEGVADRESPVFWDTQLRQGCLFQSSQLPPRCAPEAGVGTYAAAGCTGSAIGIGTSPACEQATAGVPHMTVFSGPWCARRATVMKVGDVVPLTERTVYQRRDNQCTAVGTSLEYRALGPAVPDEALQAGAIVVE